MLLLLLTTGIGEMALSENRLAPNPVVDHHFPLSKCIEVYVLVGGLEHVLFFHILGILIPTEKYFSDGLKPPTSIYIYIFNYTYYRYPLIIDMNNIYGYIYTHYHFTGTVYFLLPETRYKRL